MLAAGAPGVQQGEQQLQVGLAEGGVQAHELGQRQQRRRAQRGVRVAQRPAPRQHPAERLAPWVGAATQPSACDSAASQLQIGLVRPSHPIAEYEFDLFPHLATGAAQQGMHCYHGQLIIRTCIAGVPIRMSMLRARMPAPLVADGGDERRETADQVRARQQGRLGALLERVQARVRRCRARAQLRRQVLLGRPRRAACENRSGG